MIYPQRYEPTVSRKVTDAFGGYNHNLRIGEGEFYDMKNMTSDYYPVLANRGKRGVYARPDAPLGLIAKDSLCYVDGSEFVMDEYRVEMGLNEEEKQLISMGAYVIILPDRKYINTADLTDFGNIDAEFTTQAAVTFELCRIDGELYEPKYIQAAEPEEAAAMDLWADTSGATIVLKQWSGTSAMWVSIATTYIRISSPGIGKAFEQYDGVSIGGLGGELTDTDGSAILNAGELAALEGSAVVWSKGDDYIVITGILSDAATIRNPVTVSRKMPEMDYVTEAKNRLWGCRYGVAANGEVVNEIYASKLGDFKNWNCFMGISTDSWAGSVGTDGRFTGAITHLGYPLFFKENCLHKVYTSEIGAHSIQDTACRGVQEGCGKSLAIVGETLLYKARSGICAYDGSLPGEVSQALGNIPYGNAVGGAHGSKYYVSMEDGDGVWHLFVYDAAKGMWHREDNTHAESFCSCRGEMYFIDHDTKAIRTALGSGEPEEGKTEWMVETGTYGIAEPDAKYLHRLLVRMALEIGTRVSFYAQYDSGGEWEYLFTMTGTSLRSFSVPVRPRRCDHMRLRIVGRGNAKIFAITRETEQGSDVF